MIRYAGLVRHLSLSGLLSVASLLVLASCAQNVREEVYTTDDTAQIRSAVLNSDLNDDQKRSFEHEVVRDGYQPYGKTVATILADAQKDEAADQRAAAAAAEQARAVAVAAADRTRALDSSLKIYPDAISVVKGGHDFGSMHVDAPYEDKDTFVFLIRNDGLKLIKSFLADATLTNQGGEVLYDGSLNDATPLTPGGEEKLTISTTPTDFASLPHPELVRQANISAAIVHYTVQTIEYSDGTTISRDQ